MVSFVFFSDRFYCVWQVFPLQFFGKCKKIAYNPSFTVFAPAMAFPFILEQAINPVISSYLFALFDLFQCKIRPSFHDCIRIARVIDVTGRRRHNFKCVFIYFVKMSLIFPGELTKAFSAYEPASFTPENKVAFPEVFQRKNSLSFFPCIFDSYITNHANSLKIKTGRVLGGRKLLDEFVHSCCSTQLSSEHRRYNLGLLPSGSDPVHRSGDPAGLSFYAPETGPANRLRRPRTSVPSIAD